VLQAANTLKWLLFSCSPEKPNCNNINGLPFKSDRLLGAGTQAWIIDAGALANSRHRSRTGRTQADCRPSLSRHATRLLPMGRRQRIDRGGPNGWHQGQAGGLAWTRASASHSSSCVRLACASATRPESAPSTSGTASCASPRRRPARTSASEFPTPWTRRFRPGRSGPRRSLPATGAALSRRESLARSSSNGRRPRDSRIARRMDCARLRRRPTPTTAGAKANLTRNSAGAASVYTEAANRERLSLQAAERRRVPVPGPQEFPHHGSKAEKAE
jgi:hypothetical protein